MVSNVVQYHSSNNLTYMRLVCVAVCVSGGRRVWSEEMTVFSNLPSLILFSCFLQLYFDSCKYNQFNAKAMYDNI